MKKYSNAKYQSKYRMNGRYGSSVFREKRKNTCNKKNQKAHRYSKANYFSKSHELIFSGNFKKINELNIYQPPTRFQKKL